MNQSASIKIFLRYGDPKRLRTAEITNWSGKAVAAPRSDLDELVAREELSHPGVYFLIGQDPEDGKQIAYIGEAETVASRIKQHKDKDFWNSAIIFVSKDENLTKSHIRYLEGKLIDKAKSIARFKIDNSQLSGAKLPESDLNEMEVFLEKIAQLLPILGSDLLTPVASISKIESKTENFETNFSTEETLNLKIKKLLAKGRRTPNGFVVYEGSQASLNFRESASEWVMEQINALINDNSLTKADSCYTFTKDVEFSSPSAAARAIVGGYANGQTLWRNEKGISLKDLEN